MVVAEKRLIDEYEIYIRIDISRLKILTRLDSHSKECQE